MLKLWKYRIRKLMEAETEGTLQYRSLIEDCEKTLKGEQTVRILKQILKDEEEHCRLTEELLGIVTKQDVLAEMSKETPETK